MKSFRAYGISQRGRRKGDNPEIDTAQTPIGLDGRLILLEKIRMTFTDSIPSKFTLIV